MASSRPLAAHAHAHGHSLHRKKRVPAGAVKDSQASALDDLDDEAPFVSSSRDASEEDNDDASGYSDSASSLRAHRRETSMTRSGSLGQAGAAALSAQMSALPTSARDKALVDSKPSATGPSTSAGASPNVAPASAAFEAASSTAAGGSPPLNVADSNGQSQSLALAVDAPSAAASGARRASAHRISQKDSAAIRTTLAQAAALSSASSSELAPITAHEQHAGGAHGGLGPTAKVHSNLRRVASSSSAGSDLALAADARGVNEARADEERVFEFKGESSASEGKAARRSAANTGKSAMSLGALPAAATTMLQGGVTPKAESADQLRRLAPTSGPVNSSASASSPGAGAAHTRSLSGALSGAETETLADVSGALSDGTALDALSNDPDGTTPYDGDVEFAARAPVSQQHALGSSAGPSGTTGPHTGSAKSAAPAGPSAAAALGGSAPSDVSSTSWHAAPGQTELERGMGSITKSSVEEIRAWFRDAIYSPVSGSRDYKIKPPPDGGNNPARPVRIYADGVYDLFHYAHALQLRQAKLAFPHVHLIVGVCSSANCAQHKNEPMMTSEERYEAVRNCRWVDEVLEDAPWVIDQSLIDRLRVDYVAHDEDPYAGSAAAGGGSSSKDIYAFVKDQGKFLPTRRTPGVSTSDLLARIVDIYRHHGLDRKLEKMGKTQLLFE